MEEQKPQEKPATSFDGTDFASKVLFGKGLNIPPPDKKPDETAAPPAEIVTPLMKVAVKPDDLFKKISTETGFNFEKEEDFIDTLKKFKDFEKKEEQYAKDNLEGSNYKQFFNILPEDLKRIIVDYGAGQDYKQTIKQLYGMGDVDYSKAWNEYDDKDRLVKKYAEIAHDEWDDMDETAKKVAEKAAKRAYETERTSFIESGKQRVQQFEQQKSEYVKKYEKSITDSIARLKKDLPDMDEKKVNEVMVKMYQNPFREMVNDDGTYKEDAATRIAFAYHGQETMAQVIQRLNKEANEQVIKARNDATQGKLEDYTKRLNDNPPESGDKTDKDKRLEAIRETTKNLFYEPSSGFRNKQQT